MSKAKGKGKKHSTGLHPKIVDEQSLRTNAQLPSPADKIDHKLLLQVALNVATDTGSFYDTKFYVFSRKNSDGLVYAPKPVYANSWILRTRLPTYFEQLLSDTYGDCFTGDLDDAFPDNRKPYVDDYEYDSDSDLEDDDEDGGSLEETSLAPAGSGQSSEFGGSDGSTLLNQTETKLSGSVKPILDDPGHLVKDGASATKRTGKVLVLKSAVYPTWKALMLYLLTGEVAFRQLKSTEGPSQHTPSSTGQVTSPCSPKSMYRLAHRLGLDELKALAKANLVTNLTADNILAELFSDFASTYDDIQDEMVKFILQDATRRKTILARMPIWITRFGTGELRGSTDSLICLVNQLASGNGITSWPKKCPCCDNTGVGWRCSQCNNSQIGST